MKSNQVYDISERKVFGLLTTYAHMLSNVVIIWKYYIILLGLNSLSWYKISTVFITNMFFPQSLTLNHWFVSTLLKFFLFTSKATDTTPVYFHHLHLSPVGHQILCNCLHCIVLVVNLFKPWKHTLYESTNEGTYSINSYSSYCQMFCNFIFMCGNMLIRDFFAFA